jgi:predicted TIM-barrel fold metal-dependent hydrolase
MLIDSDVHQEVGDDDAALFPYLSAAWQDFVRGATPGSINQAVTPGAEQVTRAYAAVRQYGLNPFGSLRKDAIPPDGEMPGSDPGFMGEHLLDGYGVNAAVLTGGGTAMGLSSWSNPHYARELTRAFNDHLVDVWLGGDERYFGSISLALQVPEWAADEIRRLAGHPRMVQAIVYSNPHAYAFGHPIFDPVHRACADAGLPFAIHAFGDAFASAIPSPTASGHPCFYAECHSTGAQGIMTHLTSFILHGVFDRYPELKLVLVEGGVSWLPAFIRRLDADFKGLRREVPWCKRIPSEYIRDNVRLTTQPFDGERPDDPLVETLDELGAEDLLLFSSDYPHWDTDVPSMVKRALPDHWREKVLYRNAADLYGMPVAAAA